MRAIIVTFGYFDFGEYVILYYYVNMKIQIAFCSNSNFAQYLFVLRISIFIL